MWRHRCIFLPQHYRVKNYLTAMLTVFSDLVVVKHFLKFCRFDKQFESCFVLYPYLMAFWILQGFQILGRIRIRIKRTGIGNTQWHTHTQAVVQEYHHWQHVTNKKHAHQDDHMRPTCPTINYYFITKVYLIKICFFPRLSIAQHQRI